MYRRTIILALGSLCVGLPGSFAESHATILRDPQDTSLTGTQRVEALIEKVREAQTAVQTLTADFVQYKESSMLVEPVEATGRFYYSAPDRVRWEYETPDPIAVLITDEEMTTWYRDIDQAEKVHVGRQSQRILEYLGAGSSMDELLQYFNLTLTMPSEPSSEYFLELSPKFDKVAKRIQGMSIWVDPVRFLPARLRYVEADGDVTDMKFDNLRLNEEVAEEQFQLQIPASVSVRRIDLDRRAGLK